jgi:hypothetical protein
LLVVVVLAVLLVQTHMVLVVVVLVKCLLGLQRLIQDLRLLMLFLLDLVVTLLVTHSTVDMAEYNPLLRSLPEQDMEMAEAAEVQMILVVRKMEEMDLTTQMLHKVLDLVVVLVKIIQPAEVVVHRH